MTGADHVALLALLVAGFTHLWVRDLRARAARLRARQAELDALLDSVRPFEEAMRRLGDEFRVTTATIGAVMAPAIQQTARAFAQMAESPTFARLAELQREQQARDRRCYCGWRGDSGNVHHHVARMAGQITPDRPPATVASDATMV